MTYIIIFAFVMTILFVVIKNIKQYGLANYTVDIIINDIARLRGIFFTLGWIWICIRMMLMVDNDSKWFLLPFVLCGIAFLLMMYEKTRKVGYISFGVIFFGGIFLAIFIGIYNEYFVHHDIGFSAQTIFMVLVFSIIAGVFIYNIIKKK